MKYKINTWYIHFFLTLFCFSVDFISMPNAGHVSAQALVVCKNSTVVCDEKVAGNVCIEGPVCYQGCSGGLFPLISEEKDVQAVRGALCFSTGGIAIPQSLVNFELDPEEDGTFFVIPLFIQTPSAKIVGGCGFVHSPIILLAKAMANQDGEFLVPVELSTRVDFLEPFCEVPSIEVSYNVLVEGLLLPCTRTDLSPSSDPNSASALWANAETYAADVTRAGFTLSTILYVSISSLSGQLDSEVLTKLNRFVNDLVNKSAVSFLAEGKTTNLKKCC